MARKSDREEGDMGLASSSWASKIAIGTGHLKDVHQKLRILNFRTLIDNMPTSIDESSSTVLKYKTPNFR